MNRSFISENGKTACSRPHLPQKQGDSLNSLKKQTEELHVGNSLRCLDSLWLFTFKHSPIPNRWRLERWKRPPESDFDKAETMNRTFGNFMGSRYKLDFTANKIARVLGSQHSTEKKSVEN